MFSLARLGYASSAVAVLGSSSVFLTLACISRVQIEHHASTSSQATDTEDPRQGVLPARVLCQRSPSSNAGSRLGHSRRLYHSSRPRHIPAPAHMCNATEVFCRRPGVACCEQSLLSLTFARCGNRVEGVVSTMRRCNAACMASDELLSVSVYVCVCACVRALL